MNFSCASYVCEKQDCVDIIPVLTCDGTKSVGQVQAPPSVLNKPGAGKRSKKVVKK
jgi:hypothetical protein